MLVMLAQLAQLVSQAFIEADESDEIERLNYIQTGSVLHQIFSMIRTTDDIEDALKQLQFEGVLYDEQITPERITAMLRKRLQDPRVADWFSPRWTLFNECTILTMEDGEVKESLQRVYHSHDGRRRSEREAS